MHDLRHLSLTCFLDASHNLTPQPNRKVDLSSLWWIVSSFDAPHNLISRLPTTVRHLRSPKTSCVIQANHHESQFNHRYKRWGVMLSQRGDRSSFSWRCP